MCSARVVPWIATAVAVACAACSRSLAAPPPGPPPPQVAVARVAQRTIADWEEATGRLAAIQSVEIHPRVSGYIEVIGFDEGARVKKGDLLFRIDARPFEQQVHRAEAERQRAQTQLALARVDLERTQHLFAQSSISREELDRANTTYAGDVSALAAAEAALAAAQLDLGYTRVRAPIDGRASRALITAGNLVSNASTLTTIVSDGDLYGYFDVDESAYLKLSHERATERKVQMGLSDEQGYPHQGTLDFFDNQIDPRTGTIRGRALFGNADGRLVPGLFARVRMQAGNPAPALLIDDKAVLTDQDRKFVYVIDDHNRAQRKNIAVARMTDDGLRVVSSGLGPSDRVIVYGTQKVFVPGMPVRPTEIAMGAPPPQPKAGAAPAD